MNSTVETIDECLPLHYSSFYLCFQVLSFNEQHCQNNPWTLATLSVDHWTFSAPILVFWCKFRHSKQQLLHLRVVQIGDWSLLFHQWIGEFICRDFRVESMQTTSHVISSVILLASATSCSMDSCSFSSKSSKILPSRPFKVLSFSQSIFCCEILSCNDGSKLVIESSTCTRSFLTCAQWPTQITLFLKYFSHCCTKIRLKRSM